jgi:class 3 adenylate cyclase
VGAIAEAERRQLTVMFCDLVGSTPFDPEDLREIVGAYHRCVADTVGRFGGFVAKYMGDGVLIISAIPRRTRTTPSARSAPVLPHRMRPAAAYSHRYFSSCWPRRWHLPER